MSNTIIISLVCVAGLFRAVALGSAAGQTPTDSQVAVVEADVAKEPKLPDVGLAPVSGFDDDAGFSRSVSDHVASLLASAAGEDPGLHRAEIVLAGANLILARQIEPACSRRLLRIGGGDDNVLRAALDHADDLLAQTEELLEDSAEVAESKDQRGVVARNLKTLRAFSAGLRAYLLADTDDESSSGVRRAISLLSPLIEDQDLSVSAAATLWQACLRGRASDIPRALSVLDLAVKSPAAGTMPYAFFSGVERCRLLAMQGGRATALTLLMQVENRCEDWIADSKLQGPAVRMVQLAQMQVLEDWFDQADSQAARKDRKAEDVELERKWCVERITRMTDEGFAGDDKSLFRLGEAIPIIAEPPTARKEDEDG